MTRLRDLDLDRLDALARLDAAWGASGVLVDTDALRALVDAARAVVAWQDARDERQEHVNRLRRARMRSDADADAALDRLGVAHDRLGAL